MNKITSYVIVLLSICISNHAALGQTASSTAGCAELTVQFTAPQAPSYFWVFGDGPASVSDLQNPVHSYVQSGTYTAQLFDEENGTQVGDDITITVYPPIMIEIDANVRSGCAPLEVDFSSTLEIHPDIIIEDIIWTFGDGNSASGQNTNYTYEESGTFTISVKVITSASIKCDEPVIFQDYIKVEGEKTNFFVDKLSSCEVPATFTFTNTTNAADGTTYFWDFGNQQTSSEEGPHAINYDSEGLYTATLIATTVGGCMTSRERIISLGAPIISTLYPDTICLGAEAYLNNTTIAQDYIWDFTGTSLDTTFSDRISNLKIPAVRFTEPGQQTFTLTAIAADSCETTAALDIFVYVPNANYSLGPEISCTDPIFIEYTAEDPNLSIYTFNNDVIGGGDDITRSTPTGSNIYVHPIRDEYFINTRDSLTTRLIVTSSHGCMDTVINRYAVQKPEAFFIPDVVKGCIPFEVNFSDLSFSEYEILERVWEYGDGQGDTFSTNDTAITHTYTTPGIHEAVLTITDAVGCQDISRRVQILAIVKDTIEVPPVPFECPVLNLCVGDSLSIAVQTDQINTNMHIESDESRFNHCWKDVNATHAYQYPGVYPINATLEFYTIYIDSLVSGCFVTVEGSRSDIDYFIDCENPYEVNFSAVKSINADQYEWYLGDQLISNAMTFSHTFDDGGTYTVYLDTRQNGVNCEHRDSVLIHITEIVADINIPDKTCVSVPTPLDASLSQDVHDDCHAGYLWQFENQRPREVNDSILNHILLPGFQTITLIVEDINGCTDTISSTTTAYDLQANFIADTLICLPSELELTNLSQGDTTIVNWDWDFGGSTSTLESPVHIFDTTDFDPNFEGDSITVTLIIEDAIGCIDSSSLLIKTYDIFSEMMLNNGPDICQNEMITFSAADYNIGGSFLNYEWDFGTNGSSTEDSPTITFDVPGEHIITLTFTEDASGCQGTLDTLINVAPTPVADFISNQDSTQFICFPEQIAFTNTSIISSDTAIYSWDFGNGAISDIKDPIIPFDKGTYEVQLIVRTFEGCVDTFARSYTLVGPEGNFTVDKDRICPGEEITFTLENAIDVSSYTWDFGDGVQINDQSPVTHTYNNQSSVVTFTPTLILRSDQYGCELIQDIPITVSSITADFEALTGLCPGAISFFSDFVNPQTIEWNIDGQIIVGTSNPAVEITSDEPTIDVTLSVTDSDGCKIERMQTIDNPDLGSSAIKFPNVFSPNGDAFNPTFNIVYDQSALESEVQVVEFKVYDRWGELLYDNENPTVGWDGSYKGAIVPPDVYAFYIEVFIEGCESKRKKGNVTVIK